MTKRRTEDGRVRIIGGRWRGRKLDVASRAALRPTPDRVRETLFNWLGAVLPGAECLDLFAGTGVLGLEALSRGAAAVTLLDNDPVTVANLQRHCTMLGAADASVVETHALQWLRLTPPRACDIVFVDPPFGQGLLSEALECLAGGWLKPQARVYLEAEKIPILALEASGWQFIRDGRTRHVEYALVKPTAP